MTPTKTRRKVVKALAKGHDLHHPQVASVGLTEAELMKREGICNCRTLRIEQVPKARVVKDRRGTG